MKYIFLIVLAFPVSVFAQYDQRVITPYNKFVLEPEIEWAIYGIDTLQTNTPDLKAILIDRMNKKQIKAVETFGSDTYQELQIRSMSTEEIQRTRYPTPGTPIYDPEHTIVHTKPEPTDENIPPGKLHLRQILFVKAGKLRSCVSFVAPALSVTTPQGLYIGESEYFVTGLNADPDWLPAKTDTIIFLKTTVTEFYVDSVSNNNRYKETFGRNLSEVLWQYLFTNGNKIYEAGTDQRLYPDDLNILLLGFQGNIHPQYNYAENREAGTMMLCDPVKIKEFQKISITQNWYYDQNQNILFNKIPSAILYAHKNGDETGILKPIIRIVF